VASREAHGAFAARGHADGREAVADREGGGAADLTPEGRRPEAGGPEGHRPHDAESEALRGEGGHAAGGCQEVGDGAADRTVLAPVTKPGPAGPCRGNACIAIALETVDRCVWLRNDSRDVVLAEVRLATETIKMTLEKPDMAKVITEAHATLTPRRARQLTPKQRVEQLRKGSNVAPDPKVEEPRIPTPAPAAAVDRSRAWHGMKYDPFSGKDEPVFHARIDRAGGCVADLGEILGYRVSLASVPPEEERVIPCTGEACPDVDASAGQVGICRLANRGGREIAVGIVRSGNKDVSVQLTLRPNGTVRLDFFAGCLKADEIGRIEARYK